MSRRKLLRNKWGALIGTVLFFALGFVVAMLLYGLGYIPWGNWGAMVNMGLLFGSLGALYGTVAALDSSSGMSVGNYPRLRILICAGLGALVVLSVQSWPPASINLVAPAIGAGIGATLGWLGWGWAKYVDF